MIPLTRRTWAASALGAALADRQARASTKLAALGLRPLEQMELAGVTFPPAKPPKGLRYDPDTGLLLNSFMTARHIYDKPTGFSEAPRIVITPKGDYFTAFPAGSGHQWGKHEKVNEMTAYRSRDKGRTWEGPVHPWKVPYNQHAFNPVIPKGSKRIYTFGLEPPFETMSATRQHSGPLAMRYSDDDGHTWSKPEPIRPVNDPEYVGVCHMQMCETGAGTWLLGTYTVTNIPKGAGQARRDRQQVLRSTDRGKTWTLVPGPEHGGWYVKEYDRMLEGQVLSLGGKRAVMFSRVPSGRIWEMRTEDDGLTWSEAKATTLVHPDAPPMVFHIPGKRLAAFIHNRSGRADAYDRRLDRRDLWVCLSSGEGRTWSEPRLAISDACEPIGSGWTAEVSYADLLVDGATVHLLFDHKKKYILHVRFQVSGFDRMPTAAQLAGKS